MKAVIRRTIAGNVTKTIALIFGPDRQSIQAASLGMATNTFSPMSAGRHSPGASSRGFTGDRGYGVNRMSGRSNPLQFFAGAAAAVRPVGQPGSKRLGARSGVSGGSGLPSTGSGIGMPGGAFAPRGWGA